MPCPARTDANKCDCVADEIVALQQQGQQAEQAQEQLQLSQAQMEALQADIAGLQEECMAKGAQVEATSLLSATGLYNLHVHACWYDEFCIHHRLELVTVLCCIVGQYA